MDSSSFKSKKSYNTFIRMSNALMNSLDALAPLTQQTDDNPQESILIWENCSTLSKKLLKSKKTDLL